MHWRQIKEIGQITTGDETYDLTHLQDVEVAFTIEATDKYPEINARMLLQYSSHCVSRGPARGAEFDFAEIGHAFRIIDERDIERCFCPDRCVLSENLPSIMESLSTDRPCFFTRYENWMTTEILDSQGIYRTYDVFFRVRHESSRFLRVYVESAYVRTEDSVIRRPSHFTRGDKIRGKVLLAKKLRNEQIRRPPKR